MTISDEIKELNGRVVAIVNRQALNSWLRFGTANPPLENSDQRPLAGAELFRWAGQRSRGQKPIQQKNKE